MPLVVDLAAMRSAVKRLDGDPKIIEPLVSSRSGGRSPVRWISLVRRERWH